MKLGREALVNFPWCTLQAGSTPFALKTCQLTSLNLMLTLVVLLEIAHSLNGGSPSFLSDLGMYGRTGNTELVMVATGLPLA